MSEATNSPTELFPAPAPRPRNNAWMYYFVFVIVASISVAWLMIWYNRSIQLTEPQLEAALKLWKEKGPKSYDMEYTDKLNDDANVTKFKVKVRKGNVEEVIMNGSPLAKNPGDLRDPRIYRSMDALFADIEQFMNLDQKPGAPKVYVIAEFSEKNGALMKYVRRVMGTTKRVERIVTSLKAVDD